MLTFYKNVNLNDKKNENHTMIGMKKKKRKIKGGREKKKRILLLRFGVELKTTFNLLKNKKK